MKTVPGQKTFTDYGRLDAREVPSTDRLIAPPLLRMGHDAHEAVHILVTALGLTTDQQHRVVESPIETIIVRQDNLLHLVIKRDNARERFANFIIPTLMEPYEIWATQYEDGVRNRYIGLFTGKYDMAVVARVNLDGSLLWNIMNVEDKKLNKHREGELLWIK